MIQLNYGDKLRFTCSFQHIGAAYTGAKLRAAIGNRKTLPVGNLGWFDEILWSEVAVTGIYNDSTEFTYTKTVDVAITTSIAGGNYEAYVKLMSIPGSDIFWEGPLDDIVIVGGAKFQNLNVTYQKA